MRTNLRQNKLVVPITIAALKNDLTNDEQPKKYKALLYSIAIHLGLDDKESEEITENICLAGERDHARQKKSYTMKLWLSKMLVHHCIFRISSRLFSENRNAIDHLNTSPVLKIPISYRIVYILIHIAGFTEMEAAQILNCTRMQVSERLAKALLAVKSNYVK